MKAPFLFTSAAFVVACSGAVANDEVVLSAETLTCPITRGVDVCAYFEESRPAIRKDMTIALQRSSTLAMRSRNILRRAAEACDAIARDLGKSAGTLDPTPMTLKESCERAANALSLEIATTTLRAKVIAGSCPRPSAWVASSCVEARERKAPPCTPSTMEITGGGETTLRARLTLEKNLLILVDAMEEGLQITAEISDLAPPISNGTTPYSTRDSACSIPLALLVHDSIDDIQAVANASGMVLGISAR